MELIQPQAKISRLLPILTHIQTHLAGDLSLEKLADIIPLSPFHFHRNFKETIGETVKQYTQRLRLEQAAYQLKIQDAAIVDIALNAGYKSHETFSRAFRRQFKLTPRAFRQQEYIGNWLDGNDRHLLNELTEKVHLSTTSFQETNPISVAFIRHLGPYIEADISAIDRLIAWAKSKGFYDGQNLLLGVGHDDPNITPIDKVRFDACLQVPASFSPDGEIGYQIIPDGTFAVTTYIGPFGRTLEQAYEVIFQKLFTQTRYSIIGLPVIEIYRTTKINPAYALNHTDIYIPVQKNGD